jgi:transposase-like protein
MGAILGEVDTSDRCPLGVEMDTSQQAAVVPKDRESSVALKRQRRSIAEKRRIVEETLVEGASVARVARAHGVNANQVFYWRKLYQAGRLGTTNASRLLPVRLTRESSPPAASLRDGRRQAARRRHAGAGVGAGQGKTKTGRLWTYVRDDRPAGDPAAPAVWFAYSPDRKGEHPAQHLEKFRGTLQADAYAGFNQLYADGRIEPAACWAHVRRHFYDLEQAHSSPVAREALQRIGALYGVEEPIRGRPPDERRAVRQAEAKPLLDSLRQWLEVTLLKLSRKSETTVAIRYALSRWDALLRYIEDGHIEIDNNAAERCLRGVALGRKNYLFAGSDAGGERAAAIYSLIGSAKLNVSIPKPICARC